MTTQYGTPEPHAGRAGEAGDVYRDEGEGWLTFAAVMLGIAGVFNVIDGIVALSKSKFYSHDAVFVFSDLRTWGWIVLVIGALQVLAAVGVVSRNQWARWFGIAVAAVNAIAQLMFVQAYPFWALTAFAVDLLVVYALSVHGGRRRPA
jgi:hypothetical protein